MPPKVGQRQTPKLAGRRPGRKRGCDLCETFSTFPALFEVLQPIPDQTLMRASLGPEPGCFPMLGLPARNVGLDLFQPPDRRREDDPAFADHAAAAIAHRPALDQTGRFERALVAPDRALVRADFGSDVALALVADRLTIRACPVPRTGMAGDRCPKVFLSAIALAATVLFWL